MDSPTRSLVKALTWQMIGLFTMTLLAWIATGSLAAAGSLAVSAAVTGFICFVLHERVWARIEWGRTKP